MAIPNPTKSIVDGSFRLLRAPLDLTFKLTGSTKSPAKLAVDRAEASVKGAAGTLLGEPRLKQDAEKGEAAVRERERALLLQKEAERSEREAEAAAAEKREQAAERRAKAKRAAAKKTEEADKRRQAEKAEAKRAAAAQKKALKEAADKTEKENANRARAAELESLAEKEKSLAAKEEAVRADRQSDALAEAATAAKKRRKS